MSIFINRSGIYKITNLISNNIYIGSSVNLNKRFGTHISNLRKNQHCNKHLQNSWNKYGEENFKFEILLLCESFELIRYEQFFIHKYEPEFNKRLDANSNIGIKLSEEHKNKISTSLKGRRPSEATLIAARKSRLGSHASKETLEKMSAIRKGQKKNFKSPIERGRNISKAKMGHPVSSETREKLKAASTGKSFSAKVYKGIVSPNGEIYDTIINLNKFCRDHGLNKIIFLRIVKGVGKQHKGWTVLKECIEYNQHALRLSELEEFRKDI